jgi:hypothetical protein
MDKAFVNYVHSFYGKGGIYVLSNADGKTVTRPLIESLLPKMQAVMKQQRWNWGDGDSLDREFFREEVLEPMGYFERGI